MNKLRSRNRLIKNKKVAIICFILMFITIGFAALSATLGIVSNARIAKVKWDVHFENIDILSGSVETTSPALINESNPTQINFGVDFTAPGDYYEFEVDVVNAGTIDAKIDTITLDGLSEEQSRYIDYTYWYTDGLKLDEEDALPAGTNKRIIVKLEFKFDINPEDLPTEATEINLNFQVKYVQDRGEGIRNKAIFYEFAQKTAIIDNVESRYVANETGIDFSFPSSTTNGQGLYVRAGTENDKYPIIYYRGSEENNVRFAGFCWKIVRTTETGGTKLVYNGIPNEGKCNSTGMDTTIGYSKFNENANSMADVGYMYGERYEMQQENMKSIDTTGMKFANDVHWNGTEYELIDTIDGSGSWENDYERVNDKHRYTCLSTADTCGNVYYITYADYYKYSSSARAMDLNRDRIGFVYINLENGKTLESAKTDMTANNNDSTIKTFIDTWYEKNLKNFNDYLETDAIWCNNRALMTGSYLSKDADIVGSKSSFRDKNVTIKLKDEEVCPNVNDRFTVNSSNVGNKKLKYPIGLLTESEYVLFHTNDVYLSTGSPDAYIIKNTPLVWEMNPSYIDSSYRVTAMGMLQTSLKREFISPNVGNGTKINIFFRANNTKSVKPAISLNKDVKPVSGDGTASNPFVITSSILDYAKPGEL